MKEMVAKVLSYLGNYKIRKHFTNMILYASLLSNERYIKKNAISCGVNVRFYKPISILNPQYFEIGNNFKMDYFGIFEAWDKHGESNFTPRIKIGNNVSFGKNCHIGVINYIEIGDNVLAGSNVMIIDHNHGKASDDINTPPNQRVLYSPGKVIIGNNVWIGEKVSILPNVHIGNNCIIGANSVVTHDIPDYSMVCGSPARVVKILEEKSE